MVTSDTLAAACVGADVGLLAAALIVLSLLELRRADDAKFRLDEEVAVERARRVLRVVRVTVWASGVGSIVSLTALACTCSLVGWASLGLTVTALCAFMAMAVETINAVAGERAN